MPESSNIHDKRAQARARLEARMARLGTEEGRSGSALRGDEQELQWRRANQISRRSRKQAKGQRSQNAQRRSATPIRKSSAISPRVLICVLLALVFLLIFAFVIRGCFATPDDTEANISNTQQSTSQDENSDASMQEVSIDQAALAAIMGDELAAQMIDLSVNNSELYWIASHPDAVGVDGAKAQRKLLKLATLEPAAVSFVRNYPDLYPDDTADPCDPLGTGTDIPLLMQWDQRWAYTVYSSAAFGQTGCCPTCMAMVYQGLTRKTDLSPYNMGQLSRERGFMAQYAGTDSQFLVSCAPDLGLKASKISVDEDTLRQSLSAGNVVIANVGPGDFTEGGHYIVLVGLDENGMIMVNDPYSVVNSERTWSVEEIIGQTKRLFEFER